MSTALTQVGLSRKLLEAGVTDEGLGSGERNVGRMSTSSSAESLGKAGRKGPHQGATEMLRGSSRAFYSKIPRLPPTLTLTLKSWEKALPSSPHQSLSKGPPLSSSPEKHKM